MREPLKLLCVLAHPDDETLGTGGILAHSSTEGVETYLITATRGEYGWPGAPEANPGPETLGKLREAELHAAGAVLGIKDITVLDYIDGQLDQANPDEVISHISYHLRRIRPQVVVTFDPFGVYGHPDHIAIAQFTTAAIVTAAACDSRDNEWPPHRVSKLYYFAEGPSVQTIYESVFGELIMNIDGIDRRSVAWPEWSLTTRINTQAHWRRVWQAAGCHRTQLPEYQSLVMLPDHLLAQIWGQQTFYRAFSLVNGGREIETDLFTGLRESAPVPEIGIR